MEEGQRRVTNGSQTSSLASLNPCCNGRGSKTMYYLHLTTTSTVLILVVMEEGQRQQRPLLETWRKPVSLNPCCNGRGSKTKIDNIVATLSSLNPCCNGRGSKTSRWVVDGSESHGVLILVVMEEGQRRGVQGRLVLRQVRFNSCCNGRGSKTYTFGFRVRGRSLNPCCNGRGSKTK